MSDPIDDSGNYTQPITVAGPTKFTGTATASTAEQAELIARESAKAQALAAYGTNTTEFVSFDEIRVKFNPSTSAAPTSNQLNTPGFTGTLNTTGSYTATVITTATQIAPPSVSGLSETEQQAFLDANNALQGDDQTAEQLAFLEANQEPQTITDEPYPDEFAGVDEAIAQQQQIAINTSGLPVLAEDGSVAQGVLINPETGEVYYTEPPAVTEENDQFPPGNPEALQSGESATITVTGRKNKPETEIAKSMDWRFRISLATSAKYLYKFPNIDKNNILYPLAATDGVIFPYTPQINLTYSANYTPTDLPHSNYKTYNYNGSSVENINISGDFTAQDTVEANYMLAVMHFFKSVTKMFYGQDENPIRGTPPPLCYLTGHGTYGFDMHPVVITSFSLNYPTDVDYINAGPGLGGSSGLAVNTSSSRLSGAKLNPGGTAPGPKFSQGAMASVNTRVPIKLSIQLSCLPIVTRYDISNNFSLEEYATGKLLRSSSNKSGRGIW